ncbi:light-harvesting complex-like protein OHP2, chloroplastic [Syzygium oleosum]|uniref:light-harvesting complex-like protein OHP2, chloroplastic n=1 Tax=Syzygium oleosum TaxID=219896 RepID=UPI0024B92CD1|nr:light-harvesting complex-like protein OHP2, chloroplastic [Syzygium oleosum]
MSERNTTAPHPNQEDPITTQEGARRREPPVMCVSSSAPCLKIPPSSSAPFRFSAAAPRPPTVVSVATIRCSQTEGPLRRPVAPPLRPVPPSPPPSSSPPSAVAPPPQQPKPPVAAPDAAVEGGGAITLEFQRQKAKELQEYFKKKKLEESNQGPFFGFIGKNEIANGRWAMFGFAVGMLTEYATGSNFVDQVKILLSNFGIADLE